MCDYSLAGIPNRLAVEGEQLVVHQFPGSLGLASPCPPLAQSWSEKASVAVCIPPGARLLLLDIPVDVQSRFHVGASAEVTFVQLSANAYQYRDAVRFEDGQEILLQKLRCGQRVDVLCLSGTDSGQEEKSVGHLKRNTAACLREWIAGPARSRVQRALAGRT